jgi:phage associated protein
MSWFCHLRAAGRPIAYYPQLAKPLGGVNAVILFSHFLYWNERSDCALGVYKSAAEIEDETGLSVQEQRTARKRLRDLGVLIETEKRIEHRIYFRLDEAAFDALMDATFANESCNIPEMQNQHSGSDDSTFADEGFNTRGVAIQRSFKEQKTTSENYQKTTAEMGVCADAPPARDPAPREPSSEIPKPPPAKPERFDAWAVLSDMGVERKHFDAWMQARKRKRLSSPIDEVALGAFLREIGKVGLSAQDAARMCAEKGWGSIEANWDCFKQRAPQRGNTYEHQSSAEQYAQEQAARMRPQIAAMFAAKREKRDD